MTADQNYTTRSSITTLLQPFWNRRIQSIPIFFNQLASLLKSGNKKAFTSHIVFETERMRYRAKMVRFKTEMMRFIMVIKLSGVQFGLKSYAWFQNRTSAQREFDLKSQVWFQTKIARHEVQLPLYYIHFEIAEFSQY